MALVQEPPRWTDRDSCFRCHTSFSPFTRKHHCRACGETFCSTCSSKSSSLVEFGITDQVRVCESCYDRLISKASVIPTPMPRLLNKTIGKSQAELDDEDALQLAISLSESEAEERERQKKLLTQQYAMSTVQYPPTPVGSAPILDQTDNDQKTVGGELSKYIDRNYCQEQTNKDLGTVTFSKENQSSFYVNENEIDSFINIVNEHINNIKFRMLSNQQRGRNIVNDTAVQSIFIILQQMYPELHRFIKRLDDKQVYYENLQDKLNQMKDAREALDALRDEHIENRKRQASERQRQRQIQLAVKLDDLRQKKQAYMEYQRQRYLQCLAEQEHEMQLRLEQQRRYTQEREQQNHIDYRINQIPFIQSPPSIGYFNNLQAPYRSELTYQSFPSMQHLTNALPQSAVPVSGQMQQPYFIINSSENANEQSLINLG